MAAGGAPSSSPPTPARDPARGFSLAEASPRWWLMLAALIAGFLWLYARPGEVPAPQTIIDGPTMGTSYRVVIEGAVEDRAALRRAIESELDQVVELMSTYETDSELSRLNRHESLEPFTLSEQTADVLALARQIGTRSGGSFDVTVGPLVNLYGFGPEARPERAPSDTTLSEILEYVGPSRWALEGHALTKRDPRVQIDLSAIAKGYAVDRVAQVVGRNGHTAFLVEVGGEVRTRGQKANGEPFRVGIEEPREDSRAVHAVVGLSGQSLATSGNYRIFYERDGVRYVHTIDPRTGKPVAQQLLSASVVDESCARADAWATALMAAGDDAWRLAGDNGLEVLLLYSGANGAIEEKQTAGFAALRIDDPPRPAVEN